MANEVNIYEPRYLARVVETAPPLHTFLRDTFFTQVETSPAERIDFDLVKGTRKMAAFVHPRMGAEIIEDQGYETKSFTAPLLNPADLSTAEKYMTRLPGETLYSGMTPADRAARQLIKEHKKLEDAVTRREEWMCAQALTTGKIPVVGKGVNVVIDFGLTNKPKLTGTNVWGGTTAKPLKNLDDWVGQVADNGFANVDMAIMGKTALEKFVEDANVQKVLDNRRFYIGEIAPRDMPNGVRYVGHINSPALDIYTYTEKFLDDWTDPDEPELKPLIPDNMVLLMSSAADYTMAYGLCTYIDDVSKQWVSVEGRRLMRSYVEHNPDRRMLELQARPLPIPIKVDSWLAATVL